MNFDRIGRSFSEFIPDLLIALAVLIVGWLIALALAAAVRWLLSKTTIDNRISRWISDDPDDKPPVEKILSQVVFWLAMVFVLVIFFQVLDLPQVTGPLNNFLHTVFGYLPNLLGAALLLLVAWLLAKAARFLVRKALDATNLDDKLHDQVTVDDPGTAPATYQTTAATTPAAATDAPVTPAPGTSPAMAPGAAPATASAPRTRPVSLAKTISDTVYWLVFLLFLPLILDTLELGGLLTPVNSLIQEILSFLPNLLAALLILGIGWVVARIIQRIVTNLLAAAGADRLGTRVGTDRVLGGKPLSGVIGVVVYVLILIPVLIAALNALDIDAVTAPASQMLDRFLTAIPLIFAAAVLLVLAWIVAKLLAGLVTTLLASAGFDAFIERLGFVRAAREGAVAPGEAPAEGSTPGTITRRRPSELVGYAVLVALMLFASIEALSLLDFTMLSAMLTELTLFLADVLLGLLILALGVYLANLAARAIRSSDVSNEDLLARFAWTAVVVLAAAMALRQVGVAEDIINLAFGLILGAAAVAAAIAFGIGGRDIAHRYLERWTGRLDERASTGRPGGGTAPGGGSVAGSAPTGGSGGSTSPPPPGRV